jgi:hypothetical protein
MVAGTANSGMRPGAMEFARPGRGSKFDIAVLRNDPSPSA